MGKLLGTAVVVLVVLLIVYKVEFLKALFPMLTGGAADAVKK